MDVGGGGRSPLEADTWASISPEGSYIGEEPMLVATRG